MLNKLSATLLVLLIVSPFTAPFQTCDLAPHGAAHPTHDLRSTPTDGDCASVAVAPRATTHFKRMLLVTQVPGIRTTPVFVVSDDGSRPSTNRRHARVQSVLRV